MCGRFSLMAISEVLTDRFKVEINQPIQPRYNIAPSQPSPVILTEDSEKITMATWGLIPHWAKDQNIGYKMINARVETIKEKPAYKMPFFKQRCLVLADGFYEWKNTAAGKIPYRFIMKDEQPFAFAGIYDYYKQGDETLLTFSIITVEPNEIVKPIHDRMPAILKKEHEKLWLEHAFEKLLLPYPAQNMKAFQVSTLLNNPANDYPDVIKPIKTKTLFDY